jgi:hypothetical protein
MNVAIEIKYISNGNKVMQRGSFTLKGKKPEEIAFQWWRKIRMTMPYWPELEKITVDGEDITNLVMEMDETPLEN